MSCSCGHVRRALPWRAPADGQWQKAELGEWRPEGRHLAGVIVLRALSMRLSRARIRELLMKLLELTLRTGVIAETIQEAVRASLPLENTLQGGLSDLLISDGYFVYRAWANPRSGVQSPSPTFSFPTTPRNRLAALGDFAHPQPRRPLRRGAPYLRFTRQPHRNQSPSRSIRVAVPRHRDRRRSQGLQLSTTLAFLENV